MRFLRPPIIITSLFDNTILRESKTSFKHNAKLLFSQTLTDFHNFFFSDGRDESLHPFSGKLSADSADKKKF